VKIGICNEIFKGWPFERACEYATRLGYEGIEIAPFTLADSVADIPPEKRRELRRAAEDSGIEVIGLHWILATPEGLHISHPDAAIRIKTQEYLRSLIRFCAEVGGKVLAHGSPQQRKLQESWDPSEAWKRARETFEACLDSARECGVTYCIEPLTRTNTNFINTVEEALRMVEEINHPNFQMMVDCRSAAANEGDLAGPILRALQSGHLRHVHVNDLSGKGPGFGAVPFSPALRPLLDGGYARYISVEVFDFDPDPQTVAARSIGYLKGILEALREGDGTDASSRK
jgi:sugar phosphate isomerase/epimerase